MCVWVCSIHRKLWGYQFGIIIVHTVVTSGLHKRVYRKRREGALEHQQLDIMIFKRKGKGADNEDSEMEKKNNKKIGKFDLKAKLPCCLSRRE